MIAGPEVVPLHESRQTVARLTGLEIFYNCIEYIFTQELLSDKLKIGKQGFPARKVAAFSYLLWGSNRDL
jgi:hypothetical protein